MAIVYVLQCADGSLYTGYTLNLPARLVKHQAGKASRYTRSRLPVRLFAWWETEGAGEARSAEARFKLLSRPEKFAAVQTGRVFGYRVRRRMPRVPSRTRGAR